MDKQYIVSEIERLENLRSDFLRENPGSENHFTVKQYTSEIEGLKLQLEPIERVQQQEQHIDSLMNTVVELGLFRVVVPEPAEGERLYAYEEKEKNFNQLLHTLLIEQQQSFFATHNAELDEKNAKIQELNETILFQESQLENASKLAAELEETRKQLAAEVEDHNFTKESLTDRYKEITELEGNTRFLENELKIAEADKARLGKEVEKLNAQLAELEKKVESQSKSKFEPSVTLKEQVDKLKNLTAIDKADRALARLGLIEAPQIDISPFRGSNEQVASGVVEQSTDIAQEVTEAEVMQAERLAFRETEEVDNNGGTGLLAKTVDVVVLQETVNEIGMKLEAEIARRLEVEKVLVAKGIL